jgi:hypothetical protein
MAEFRDGKRVLVNPNGQLVQVDPGEAQAKVASGLYADAHPDQIKAYDSVEQSRVDALRQSELQSAGNIAKTGLEGLLEGVASPLIAAGKLAGLGNVVDRAAEAFTSPEAIARVNQEMAARREANPITSGVSRFVGQMASLAPLGLGSAGAGAVERAGGGKLLQAVLGQGMEGAAFGASDAALDPNSDAQHVLAAGGLGALLGAGTGAALHGAASGLARVFGKGETDIASRALADAQSSIERDAAQAETTQKGKLAQFWDTVTGRVTGAPKSLLEDVGPTGVRRAEAIKAAEHYDQWADQQALKMQKLVNESSESLEDVTRVVSDHHLKESTIRDMAGSEWDNDLRKRTAMGVMYYTDRSYREAISGLADTETLSAATQRQLSVLESQMAKTSTAMTERNDSASRFIMLDDMKRRMQKTVLQMRTDAQRSTNLDSFEKDNLLLAASKVEKVQEELRQSLMSPKIWGDKVAGAQREINEVWEEGAIDALNGFGHHFQRWTGQMDYDTGRRVYEADPARLLSSLKSLGTANGAIAERSFDQYLYHIDKLVERIGDRYELPATGESAVARARERFAQLSEMYKEAKTRTELANKFRELETYNAGGLMGHSAPIAGAVLGHGPGFVAGSLLKAAASPADTARMLQGVSGAARKLNASNMVDSLGSWIRSGAENTEGLVRKVPGTSAVTGAAVHLFRGKYASDDEATQARTRALLQADPSQLGEHLPGVDDSTMFAAGGVASQALTYLRAQLPPYLSGPDLLNPNKRLSLSLPEQMKFARVWGTVADPSTAVKDLKSGRLTPAQVDALQAVYPSIYNDMRNETLKSIGMADAAGKAIPIQVRSQLDLLLKLNGAGQRTLSDGFAERVSGILAAQQQSQKPQQRGLPQVSSKIANSRKTPFENSTEI